MLAIENNISHYNNSIRVNRVHDSNVENNTQSKSTNQDKIDPSKNKSNAQNTDTVEINGRRLTRKQLAILLELKKRDQQVHQHEMAHLIAGGQYVRGGPNYVYEVGPDGRRYAVGGDVSIDTSPERDPRATLRKMLTVERAALAPANPSAQDRAVAAKAAQEAAKAQMEIIEMQQSSNKKEIYSKAVSNNLGNQQSNNQTNSNNLSNYQKTNSPNVNNLGSFLDIFA